MTNEAKQTPGPWERSERSRWVVLGGARSKAVCVMRNQNDHDPNEQEADANARLIAAAPDLLAALRDAALIIDADHLAHVTGGCPGCAVAKRARAAIARAEGRDVLILGCKRCEAMKEALEEILEMAADREDIRDTADGRQAPNEWMRVAQICRRVL